MCLCKLLVSVFYWKGICCELIVVAKFDVMKWDGRDMWVYMEKVDGKCVVE